MFCTKCGNQVTRDAQFCTRCGNKIENTLTEKIIINDNRPKCPHCGSTNLTFTPVSTTNTSGKTKGFGSISACLGFILFGWIGVLCGLCGMGKGKTTTQTTTQVIKVCQNCGYRF